MKYFHILLKRYDLLREVLLVVAATIISCSVAASLHSTAHPDSQQAVHKALLSHDLASITVDQDQDKGVIRLTGVVASTSLRDRVQLLAQQAAAGYTIDNQIQVNRAGLM